MEKILSILQTARIYGNATRKVLAGGPQSGHIVNLTGVQYKLVTAILLFSIVSAVFVSGCGTRKKESPQPVEITILAAASLTDVCNEIKTKYEAANKGVMLTFSYGSSGALQTQIEEGAPADLFMSAATKQMMALDEKGLMESGTITELLENKVVLIVPKDSSAGIETFEDVATEKVSMIGLGDPASVPVGQYSEEIFTSLGILETVKKKANYGTDVRNVLSWVETGVVDCGVVYATDANISQNVTVVTSAPEGTCKPVIYPVGVVKASKNKEAARAFMEYLQTDEIMELFETYGFSTIKQRG